MSYGDNILFKSIAAKSFLHSGKGHKIGHLDCSISAYK